MIKICPNCGTEFSFDYRECHVCHADLSSVRIYYHPRINIAASPIRSRNDNLHSDNIHAFDISQCYLSDEQFKRIEKYFPLQRGNVKIDNIKFINAILYKSISGCKWRDLPLKFGKWTAIYKKYSRWSENGIMEIVLDALVEEKLISQKMRIRLEKENLLSRADIV